MFGFSEEELQALHALSTPQKIQDFLDSLEKNSNGYEDTCRSPRMVLATRRAHCIEGAMFAAAALRVHGFRPLVVDMTAADFDYDHVVAVFRQHGSWGAISRTNYAVLRYREPVYRTIRELVMSYFHEYTDEQGRKSLRSFSMPVNLARFDKLGWMTSESDVWYIPRYLSRVPHRPIVNRSQIARFRKLHEIEFIAGNMKE